MESVSIIKLISAIAQLMLMALVGFVLFKKKITDRCALDFIAKFIVNVSTPAFILFKMSAGFDLSFRPSWWIFFLISVIFYIVGLILSSLIYSCRASDACRSREVKMLSVFQNCGYLPMTMAYLMLDGRDLDAVLIYTILYLFGFNFLLWSVGSWFIYSDGKKIFNVKSILNPPTVATIAVLILKYVMGTSYHLPDVFSAPLEMIGKTTFPLAMIFLGGTLADSSAVRADRQFFSEMISVVLIKLILMPLIALLFCYFFRMADLLGFFIVLQAAMPSAVNVAIAVKHHNGQQSFAAQAVVIMHLLAVFTVPLWLGLFLRMKL